MTHEQVKDIVRKMQRFASGDNCSHGKTEREVVMAIGSFLGSLLSIALIIGAIIAFGTWAIAVIAIIVSISVLHNRRS